MSKIAVIIVNYKNNKDTKNCLDSLGTSIVKHSIVPILVHVETTPSSSIIDHHTNPISISQENIGLDYANNKGIDTATSLGAKYLVILNNDTKLSPNMLDELIKPLKDKSIGLVSPKIYFYPGSEFHHQSYTKNQKGSVIWYAGGVIDWQNIYASHWGIDELDLGQHNTPGTTDFCTGCCTATTIDRIKKIGYIPTGYFLYWEDVAWSMAAKRAGYSCYYQPTATMWHTNAGSTHGSGSNLHQYYQTRNRIQFALANAPLKSKGLVIKEALTSYSTANDIRKKAIFDALRNNKGKQNV